MFLAPVLLSVAAQRLNAGFQSQQLSQSILGNANQVGPNLSPVQLAGVQATEKQQVLQKFGADIQQEALQTWEGSLRQGLKKESERRQQAIQNGWIFA
ncbi:MAG: hypothetical protein SFZ03_01850 [Candidatus Melainabacteria bacterium]|nr:hypothetical protein [Candidatus Melainabacteria bacterium]